MRLFLKTVCPMNTETAAGPSLEHYCFQGIEMCSFYIVLVFSDFPHMYALFKKL